MIDTAKRIRKNVLHGVKITTMNGKHHWNCSGCGHALWAVDGSIDLGSDNRPSDMKPSALLCGACEFKAWHGSA